MTVIDKVENGPILIVPNVYEDDRGYFYESFNDKEFREKVCDTTFVQDNQSLSDYGVIRGMHFQKGEHAQAKLVRVVQGAVLDVVLDIREGSPNYGKWYSYTLSAKNHRQLFVPRGFAHGFIALEDNTIFQYKCDNFYDKKSEGSYRYDSFGFDWNTLVNFCDFKISEKDKKAPNFNKNANKKKIELPREFILSILNGPHVDYKATTVPLFENIYAEIENEYGETEEVQLISYSTNIVYASDFTPYREINVVHNENQHIRRLSYDWREVKRFYKYE